MIKKILVTMGLLLNAPQVYSFEYEIEKVALEGFSVPGHETITSMAIDCLNRHANKEPSDCMSDSRTIGLLSNNDLVDIPAIPNLNAQELLNASSFPDDPGRYSDGYIQGIKGFASKENQCVHGEWWNFGLLQHDYSTNITGGLFCNSHYGVLQFWHAMASRPMAFENYPKVNGIAVEPFSATLEKILAWAKLTFKIAIDNKYELIDEPFCEYFGALRDDPSSEAMARAFVPDPSALPDGEQFHCNKKKNGKNYTVAFLFENECTGRFSAGKCTPIGGGDKEKWKRGVQITALGALVHLIQDSYSASHVLRKECDPNSPDKAKIYCSSIKGFMSYVMQDSDKHGKADIFPIKIDYSCSDSEVDDVVTATAKALWFVRNGNTDENVDKFIGYLKKSVFRSEYVDWKNGPFASAGGQCFSK